MRLYSRVIVTDAIEETAEELERNAPEGVRFVKIVKLQENGENFKVEDAALAVEKAYLASEETVVIVLGATQFSVVVQNKLLKIIEEPPPNKIFILLTASKAGILPTIRSRLPVTIRNETKEAETLPFAIEKLDLQRVYDLVQEHKRSDAATIKTLLEHMVTSALHSDSYETDEKSLILFSDAYRALDSGSPPAFVLSGVLLKLLAKKRR